MNERNISEETSRYTIDVLVGLGKAMIDAQQHQLDKFHHLLGQDGYSDLKTKNNHDYLTRALSRSGIYSALKSHSEQSGANSYVGIFIDVCNLREVNNQYSQYLGDKYLHMASWASRNLFDLSRSSDSGNIPEALVARWGGDEFLALFPANTSLDSTFMDFFSYSTDNTADDGFKNIATFNIDDMMAFRESHNLPTSVYRSASELLEAGISDIKFAYNIGHIDLRMGDDSLVCIQEIDDFMRRNGSKYVRENATKE